MNLTDNAGSFHGGELILIAGRPGYGKSSFAVNIAEHVKYLPIKNRLRYSTSKCRKEQIVNRIIASQAR